MSGDAALDREPLVIGDPSNRISVRGALVVIGLVVALLATVRFGFDWVVAQSDDWSLASARRVVETSTLPAATQAGLSAELDRLAVAFEAGAIEYDGLFATLQRLVEGTLVPVALLDRAAAVEGVPAADAAALTRLARSLETQDFVPENVEPLVEELRAGAAPATLGEELSQAIAGELVPSVPEPPEAARGPLDVVATFRAHVDATLAGKPPYRYAPR
jgi:hypothetical protein